MVCAFSFCHGAQLTCQLPGVQLPFLGSARVPRAGFGVAPKQSFRKMRYSGRFNALKKVRDRETRSPAREKHTLPRECPQLVGHVQTFRRQLFDIADFDVDFLYAGPFCARTKEPPSFSDDACSVERIIRDR